MIWIGLPRGTSVEVLVRISEWISEHDPTGYLGEGDIYFTDDMTVKFYPVLVLSSEEIGTLFRLTFNIYDLHSNIL